MTEQKPEIPTLPELERLYDLGSPMRPADIGPSGFMGSTGHAFADHAHRGIGSISFDDTVLRGDVAIDTSAEIIPSVNGLTVTLDLADELTEVHTITGLWTFDRDPLAPFAVTADSAVVTNLDSDKVDGYHLAGLDARYVNVTGDTMTGNLLFGAYGLGNNASVLTFAAGATGAATFAGNVYVGAKGIGNNSAILTFGADGTGTATFNSSVLPAAGECALGATGSRWAMVYANGFGGTASVLTFAAGATGLATFGGGASLGGNLSLLADNRKAIFGTGSDASVYYDGTNFILDPNEIGTGKVYVGATANDNIAAGYYYLGTSTTEYRFSVVAGWISDTAATGFQWTLGGGTGIVNVYLAGGGAPSTFRFDNVTGGGFRYSYAGTLICDYLSTFVMYVPVQMGTTQSGYQLYWTSTYNGFTYYNDCLICWPGGAHRHFVIQDAASLYDDYNPTTSTDPTLRIQSATRAATATNQYISLKHDQTNGVIAVGTGSIVLSNNTIIGLGAAGVDYSLTFDGETNDGVLTWMEDEDYFQFNDDINLNTGEVLKVGGTQVIGAQGAHVVDADAGTIVAQFNALLTRLEAHGLLASS